MAERQGAMENVFPSYVLPQLYITYRTVQGKKGGVEGGAICEYRYPALASAFKGAKSVLKWKGEPDYSKIFRIIHKYAQWGGHA